MSKKLSGLSPDEVAASRREHGTNKLERMRTKGFFHHFFENLSDPIIKILLFALALEVLLTFGNVNFIEIGGILLAILIATTVTTASEYGSERAFLKMEEESTHATAEVIRDGKHIEIPSDEVVVGDLLCLRSGVRVEADALVISGSLDLDQSALNGENIDAHKEASRNTGGEGLADTTRVYRGSVVTRGECIAEVERVGKDTFYGMVARDVQAETRESPLKLRLSRLASDISKIGYVVAALVAITYLFNAFVVQNNFRWELISTALTDIPNLLQTLLHAFTLMITVIVVAVPEGLPMMITVVLSANMKRMLKDNIMVKKLVGIETAGSLNILFTDKTGTLTEGHLSLDRIITEEGVYLRPLDLPKSLLSLLSVSAGYNTEVEITDTSIVGGNSTDRAIAEAFLTIPKDSVSIRAKTPFSSEIKYSSVTTSDGITYYKGAPEVLLQKCTHTISKGGKYIPSELEYIRARLCESQSRGERVIAVAIEVSEIGFVFVGLLVLKDKVRNGVREAVRSVSGAGIQIVMLTGDNLDTAVHIAEECGFYKASRGNIAITSEELARLTDAELKALLPSLRVLARALPQDKTRLVRISQEENLVVGMTGDGINDAPSLKLADVGFAMGSGTDIAKSAGDVVILDNSFLAIEKAVLYGRTIFKSIRKFITFQLIMNLAACGITLLGQFMGIENPITIIQMLWVNIIMDTLGGLAFAGEAPLDYYMKEKPKRRDEPILSRSVVSHIALNGAFTLALLALFLRAPFFTSLFGGESAHLTAFYALFIFAGLFNCFSARSERLFVFSNIGKNKPFILIMLLVSIIQIFIIYFGGSVFRSTPLSLGELGVAIITAASVLVFDIIRRIYTKLK